MKAVFPSNRKRCSAIPPPSPSGTGPIGTAPIAPHRFAVRHVPAASPHSWSSQSRSIFDVPLSNKPLALHQWQQSGVDERGIPVADPGQIAGIGCKRDEAFERPLPDKHHGVPMLFFRADEECTAIAQEQQFSSTLLQKRHRVIDVSLERV